MLHWRRLPPPVLFLLSFIVLIAIGTLGFLLLPGLYTGPRLGILNALFTSTSAVCVTGLIVVDTASYFTFWGQLWILLLIQLGGLGLVTLSTMIIGAMGRRLSLRSEMLAGALPHHTRHAEVWQIALRVARFTAAVELGGAIVLFALWVPHYPVPQAAWHALFHAISAYCNAGFSTFSDSLVGFADQPMVLLAISILIIVGGLGYLTLGELARWARAGRTHPSRRLSSHTYAAVVTSAALLAVGWLLFAVFEWNGALGGLSWLERLVNALFLSVTPRTAGFNNVDYAQVGSATAVLTMMLMFVGGSPGSTAGGVKTTTIAVLVALGLSRLRGRRYVELHQRAIPEDTIERGISVFMLASVVLIAGFFLVSLLQSAGLSASASHAQFLPITFEVISAFATVGLSMGETTRLTEPALLVVSLLMYIGRVGLLSFFAAMTLRRGTPPAFLRPAQEDLMVG